MEPKSDEYYAALADRAAAELTGTCQSLESLGEEFEGAINILAFTDHLDELVFCCEGCNWWCDVSELNNHTPDGIQLCHGCTEEGQDE